MAKIFGLTVNNCDGNYLPRAPDATNALPDRQAWMPDAADSRRQFKADVMNADSLAADLVAFSNSSGGVILIGIADDGAAHGLNSADVRRINQLIANAATQHMRSPISPTTESIPVAGKRVVIVLTVPESLDKPYFDRHGVMWVKTGSDRRRIQSKEELRRLFQMSGQFHADELPTKAGIEALDKLRLRDYLRNAYKRDYPDSSTDLTRLLQNLNLATDMGFLNLAGLLLFAEQPDRFMPQFTFKAIRFPGDSIHATEFLDSEDFAGPIRQLFDGAMASVLRNPHKVQAGRGVNAPGVPEIPPVVFEELLVNALCIGTTWSARRSASLSLTTASKSSAPGICRQPDGGQDPGRQLQYPHPDLGIPCCQGYSAVGGELIQRAALGCAWESRCNNVPR